MDAREPSFRSFIAAFRGHWLEAMSGAFSVPFAAAGVWASAAGANGYATASFVALAILGAWFAAYRLWSVERNKVAELDVGARREAVRLRIAELITEGAGMRNEATDAYNPFSRDELEGWSGRITAWHNVVLDALKTVSAADAEWYRTLNEVPKPAIPMAIPPEGVLEDHMQLYAMHNFRLKKLEQLVSGEKGNLLVRR
jgi:hypothetical protein